MLTLFTIPKPFVGHIGVIQKNAIRSWVQLGTGYRVILFGDEPGTAEAAAELGVDHENEVQRNEFGTPLLNDMFSRVQRTVETPLICYANADIVLADDFRSAVERMSGCSRPFLMVGQRLDYDVTTPIDFSLGWEERLLSAAREGGKWHGPEGIDYFLFPRGSFEHIPPFAVGRPAWDNWMLYEARARGARLVDATRSVTAIHQNHDFAHLSGGLERRTTGPEGVRNYTLAGDDSRRFYTIDNANWMLAPWGLMPAWDPRHVRSRLMSWLSFRPKLQQAARRVKRLVWPRRELPAKGA